MTAITVGTLRQLEPVSGIKEIDILTATTADSGYTFDASAYFTTIFSVYLNDYTGAVKEATYSGTTVTLGTITTGNVHCLRIWGV